MGGPSNYKGASKTSPVQELTILIKSNLINDDKNILTTNKHIELLIKNPIPQATHYTSASLTTIFRIAVCSYMYMAMATVFYGRNNHHHGLVIKPIEKLNNCLTNYSS